jgi:hypothetical protein
MRYLVGFVCVLAGLVALPQDASAQAGQEATTSEANLQEPASSSEPAPEEPALQLKIDSAGVEVVPSPPPTVDEYTLEEMDLRVRRAGIGLGFSGAVLVSGGVMLGIGAADADTLTGDYLGLLVGGGILTIGGLVATIITGRMLAERKRDRDSLRQAHYGTPRLAHWDLAQSRLVF